MISHFLGRWYEDNEPESIAIPDYENRILEQVCGVPFADKTNGGE